MCLLLNQLQIIVIKLLGTVIKLVLVDKFSFEDYKFIVGKELRTSGRHFQIAVIVEVSNLLML